MFYLDQTDARLVFFAVYQDGADRHSLSMLQEWCLACVLPWLPASQCHGAGGVSRLWRRHVRARFHGTLREARARAVLRSASRVGYLGGSVALRSYLAQRQLPCGWKCGPPNVYAFEQRDTTQFAQGVRELARALEDDLGCPVESVAPVVGRPVHEAGWCETLERALWALEDPVAAEHGLLNPTWPVTLRAAGLCIVVEGTRFSLLALRDSFDLSVCRIMMRAHACGKARFYVSQADARDIESGAMRGAAPDAARVHKYEARGFVAFCS